MQAASASPIPALRASLPQIRRRYRAPSACAGSWGQSSSALSHYVASCHKRVYNPAPAMLKSYLSALVFVALGTGVGGAFTYLNAVLGPRRPSRVKSEPYECGLPSEVTSTFRFGISFYLIA